MKATALAEDTQTTSKTIEETAPEETSTQEGTQGTSGDTDRDAGSHETDVVIDGIKFKSEKDALEWALENKSKLEHERAIADAYRTGIQDAAGTYSVPSAPIPKVEEDDNFEEQFYANPKEALAKREKKLAEQIRQELTAEVSQKEIEKQVWDEFSGLHPDLADFKTDVELIANSPEHLQIVQALVRTRGHKAGYDYVAQKTRAKFQSYMEAAKGKTVLPKGSSSTPTPTGAGKSVTPPKKEEKILSMRDQLRQHKSRFTRTSE